MKNNQVKQYEQNNEHAVVIGASMAGLLAARVLSDHFKQVTIIERDQFSQQVGPRKGVPQGRHSHLLLGKGEAVLRELFPELYPTVIEEQGFPLLSSQMHWYDHGAWKIRPSHAITSYCTSRPFLETSVRHFLAASSNIRFINGCEVSRLHANEDNTRITGVSLRYYDAERHAEDLTADLVVDASGRGSRTPQWLTSLGYGHVEESSVKINVGYATRIYRKHSALPADWKVLLIYPTAPLEKRGGILFPIEDDCWMVTLTSRLSDYPPDDEEGFLEYARSLPQPDIYNLIKDAEPVSPISTYRYAANRWRHYERMSCLPEGFIVLGDAMCSINPIYGQGMSVAASEAKLLDTCLRQYPGGVSTVGFTRYFQKAIVKAAQEPWQLTTSEDFRYPEAEGKRPFGLKILHWYTGRVNELTASDPFVVEQFYAVLHLLKPLTVLFAPRIVGAVLRRALSSHLHQLAAYAQLEMVYPVQQPHFSMKAYSSEKSLQRKS